MQPTWNDIILVDDLLHACMHPSTADDSTTVRMFLLTELILPSCVCLLHEVRGVERKRFKFEQRSLLKTKAGMEGSIRPKETVVARIE
jgi:hypothetical protein